MKKHYASDPNSPPVDLQSIAKQLRGRWSPPAALPPSSEQKAIARIMLVAAGVQEPSIGQVAQVMRYVRRIISIEKEDLKSIGELTGQHRPGSDADKRQTKGGQRVVRKPERFS